MLGRRLAWCLVVAGLGTLAFAMHVSAQITPLNNAPANAMSFANAMTETNPGLVTGATWVQYVTGATQTPTGISNGPITTTFGVPEGNKIVIMSSGNAANFSPGTQNGYSSTPNTGWYTSVYRGGRDVSVLRIDMNLPAGHDCVRFDFQFMTEEFPTWMPYGPYRDAFVAELDSHTWMMAGSNLNAPNNFATVPAVPGASTPYVNTQLTMSPPLAVPTRFEGATRAYTAEGYTTTAGGPHSLYLSMFDAIDSIYDSGIILDNIRTLANRCSPSPPTAAFTWLQPDPCYPIIQFADVSFPFAGDLLMGWEWDFGDGGTSNAQNPAYSYSGPGPWMATLTVTDDDGETASFTTPVELCVPPVPQFSYVLVSPCDTHNPYLQFIDESYDPDADGYVAGVHWNFGGGAYSYEPTPYHTWGDEAGVYPVILTAMDNFGTLASITVPVNFPGFVACPLAPGESDEFGPSPGEPQDGTVEDIAGQDPDEDGIPAGLDNCEAVLNVDQADTDGDGFGDLCDGDADADGRSNDADNCWLGANVDQDDRDGDGRGDLCDPDRDGDGIDDDIDLCVDVADAAAQVDADGDGIGDACDESTDAGADVEQLAGSAGGARSATEGAAPVSPVSAAPLGVYIGVGLAAAAALGAVSVAIVRRR